MFLRTFGSRRPPTNTYPPFEFRNFISCLHCFPSVMSIFSLFFIISWAIPRPPFSQMSVKNFLPTKLASAEGSFVSSTDRAASAWAKVFTCSHAALSRIAATPLALEKPQTSPRSFKISLKASASLLIHSIGPSGSPRMKLSSLEYAPTLAKLVFIFFTQSIDFSKHFSFDA
jgi:hypothetical protein